jgi:hypothetical protein
LQSTYIDREVSAEETKNDIGMGWPTFWNRPLGIHLASDPFQVSNEFVASCILGVNHPYLQFS